VQANQDSFEQGNEAIDLSNEVPAKREVERYLSAKYDPRPHEDTARRQIAYLLIGLLFVTVLCLLGMVACKMVAVGEIKEFAVILGPIITLVSAATGFYYGTKSTSQSE